MYQTVKAVVLRTIKYGDNSLIVDAYTDSEGRMSFTTRVSTGRKSGSKSLLFQPLSLLEIVTDMAPRQSLYRIKEVKNYQPFVSIPYDMSKNAMALFLAEFLYKTLREQSPNPPLFEYLQDSLAWLDTSTTGYANFHLVFLLRIARFLGFAPNTDNPQGLPYFDLLNGCYTGAKSLADEYYLEGQEAVLLTQLMRLNFQNMHLFQINRGQRKQCLDLIHRYYGLHVPDFSDMKSLGVLHELFD